MLFFSFSSTGGDNSDLCIALSKRATLLLDTEDLADLELLDSRLGMGFGAIKFAAVMVAPVTVSVSVLKTFIVVAAAIEVEGGGVCNILFPPVDCAGLA